MKRILIILFVATLAACTKEKPLDEGGYGEGGKARFTITVPSSGNSTRDVIAGSEADTRVDDILLLFFREEPAPTQTHPDAKAEFYVGHSVADEVERGTGNKNNEYLVTATLPVAGQYNVVAIANWSLIAGKGNVEEWMKALETGANSLIEKEFFEVAWEFEYNIYDHFPSATTGFIMSGRGVFSPSQTPQINLRRTVAKINIEVDGDLAAAGLQPVTNTAMGITQFKLDRIDVCNFEKIVSAPVVHDGELYHAGQARYASQSYPGLLTTMECKDKIFVPETVYMGEADNEIPYIIIEANLGSMGARFYRLNFGVHNIANHEGFLRNHTYTVHIDHIDHIGYSSVEEAKNSPENFNYTVTVTDDGEAQSFDLVTFNEGYYLGATSVPAWEAWEYEDVAGTKPQFHRTIKIKTDLPAKNGSLYEGIEIISGPQQYVSRFAGLDLDANDGKAEFTIDMVPTRLNHGVDSKPVRDTIVVKAGPMTLKIPLEQKAGGPLASPGILGVTAETGQLTMRGSKEFTSHSYMRTLAAQFGGLSDETVYQVYFKHGSLVATSSIIDDTFEFNPAEDVAWHPSQFTKAINAWSDIPVYDADGRWPYFDSPAQAIGDPCHLADNGAFAEEWHVPTGVNGTLNTNSYWGTDILRDYQTSTAPDVSGGGVKGNLKYAADETFVPHTRRRDANGAMSPIYPYNTNGCGYYWVSEANYMQVRLLNNSAEVEDQDAGAQTAAAIRCVYEVRPYSPPYILYLLPDGTLSAGQWGKEVNISNIAYTKFGSTVALRGAINGGTFQDFAVAFDPTGITYPSGSAGWNAIPFVSDTDYAANGGKLPSSAAAAKAGKGDICALVGLGPNPTQSQIAAHDSGFRLPTMAEQEMFAPGKHYNSDHWIELAGIDGSMFGPSAAMFLPAAGMRESAQGLIVPGNVAGEMTNVGVEGYFWSSEIVSTYAMALYMERSHVWSNYSIAGRGFGFDARRHEDSGLAVRCVPK